MKQPSHSAKEANGVSIVPATLRTVRPEILFENKVVSLVLVALKNGQRVECAKPLQRLLTVVKGHVRLRGPGGSLVLQERGRWMLPRGEQWKIRAHTDASISFLMVKTAS